MKEYEQKKKSWCGWPMVLL